MIMKDRQDSGNKIYGYLKLLSHVKEKVLSEVGFEPTPTFVDQNTRLLLLSSKATSTLESGALDHSAILTFRKLPLSYSLP